MSRETKLLQNFLIIFNSVYTPRGFAEVSKKLDTELKIILLNCQNNYVGCSIIMSNAAKIFDILIILMVQTNIFLNLYLNF